MKISCLLTAAVALLLSTQVFSDDDKLSESVKKISRALKESEASKKARSELSSMNSCEKSSDCEMQLVGCGDMAYSKKDADKFKKTVAELDSTVCAVKTRCKIVKCEDKKCVPAECSRLNI